MPVVRKDVAGTVSDGKDVVVPGGLKRIAHYQSVDAIGLEPVEIPQEVGRLDTGRPD